MRERTSFGKGRVEESEATEEEPELFLDSDEQSSLIEELRRKGITQNRSTRIITPSPLTQRLFQALSVALLLALFYCTSMALTMPYLLEHQSHFKVAVSPLGFVVTYIIDMICVLIAISIFQGRKDKVLVGLGIGLGLINLASWATVFAGEIPYPGFGFWWLPLTPLLIILVALFVDHDLRRLITDIDVLEKLKYSYKKV